MVCLMSNTSLQLNYPVEPIKTWRKMFLWTIYQCNMFYYYRNIYLTIFVRPNVIWHDLGDHLFIRLDPSWSDPFTHDSSSRYSETTITHVWIIYINGRHQYPSYNAIWLLYEVIQVQWVTIELVAFLSCSRILVGLTVENYVEYFWICIMQYIYMITVFKMLDTNYAKTQFIN